MNHYSPPPQWIIVNYSYQRFRHVNEDTWSFCIVITHKPHLRVASNKRNITRKLKCNDNYSIQSHCSTSCRNVIVRKRGAWAERERGEGESLSSLHTHVKGWRRGESTRLPPMWPGFNYQSRRRTVSWICGVSTLHRDVFLRVLRFSPLLENQHLIWIDLL